MPVLSEVGVSTVDPGATVREAQAGSAPAFERLYREHSARIYALCLRLAADPVQAEELTQDVFVRAWQKLDSFRGDSAFGTWLHRLAVNEVLGKRRADGRRGARVMIAEDLTIFETPRVVGQEGFQLDLEAAVATLSEATRTVFVMHDVEGYTHDEIANLTGRAEGTCKTLLHRARKMLRERLR
ncbi:MAG: sigma-70 family RNA polymerase sigma factor [Gemmatimonadetes bacterium]|nr:sigma-70 family RNA polymerase sigma factor [Gemmatimonadota bacterium]